MYESDIPIIGKPQAAEMVEACASFARRFNLSNYGGPQYESVDFFASRKLTCRSEDRRMVSEALFQECVEEVESTARNYLVEMKRKLAAKGRTA